MRGSRRCFTCSPPPVVISSARISPTKKDRVPLFLDLPSDFREQVLDSLRLLVVDGRLGLLSRLLVVEELVGVVSGDSDSLVVDVDVSAELVVVDLVDASLVGVSLENQVPEGCRSERRGKRLIIIIENIGKQVGWSKEGTARSHTRVLTTISLTISLSFRGQLDRPGTRAGGG